MIAVVRRISAIACRELASSAASPAAWVFLIIFLVLSAFCAFVGGGLFSTGQADLTPFFDWMPWLFLLIVPALAMPMWSEERRSGIFELSTSFPVSLPEFVLGKYAAGLILLAVALALTGAIPITAIVLGKPDVGAIAAGYVGAWLLGAVYLSMSTFCSALSKSQTASFLLSVLLCGLFLFIGWPQVTALAASRLPDSVVSFLAGCAFLPNYQAFQKGLIDTGELIYSISLSGMFLAVTCFALEYVAAGTGKLTAPGAFTDPAARRASLRLLIRTAYVLLFAVALNLTASTFKWRIDVTSDRAYSLSPDTVRLARSLSAPVTLRLYASFSSPAMSGALKQYAERVKWLLEEFSVSSGGRISLIVIDPIQDSVDEEAALMDGIAPVQNNAGDRIFLGVSASRADSVSSAKFLSPVQEGMLEYEIARIVLNVLNQKKPKIGIISPFRVKGLKPDFSQIRKVSSENVRQEPPWYFIMELEKDFDTVSIPEYAAEIPKDIQALMIVNPVDLTSNTLYAIDQYLMRGGRAAVFLDPRSLYAILKGKTEFSLMNKTESSLEPLTSAWGVGYKKDVLVADMVCAYRKTLPDRLITNPLALILTPEQISRNNPLFANLNSVAMYFAAPLTLTPVPDVTHEVLLRSSTNSELVNSLNSERVESVIRNFKSGHRSHPLAVRIAGKLPSAYPSGSPDPILADRKTHLAKGAAEAEIFLFSDSDMLFNDLCVTTAVDALGQKTYVRSNDNVSLIQNIMERLCGGCELASIRGRLPMSRPLTMVNEMKAAAELKYKNRILKLEQEFREVQARFNYLKRIETESGGRNFTNEQKAELRAFRIRLTDASRELKMLRGELKRDLNLLENRIRLINLLLVPLLVSLAGILWSVIRLSKGRVRR